MRAALVLAALTMVSSLSLVAAGDIARYDTLTGAELSSADGCGAPNVVCFATPAGADHVLLSARDDVAGDALPVPFQVSERTTNGFVLGVGCGSADAPALPGATIHVIFTHALTAHVCDYPCSTDCTVRAVATRGGVTATFH